MKTRTCYYYRLVARYENESLLRLDLKLEKAIQEAWRESGKPTCVSAVIHRSLDGLNFLPYQTVK